MTDPSEKRTTWASSTQQPGPVVADPAVHEEAHTTGTNERVRVYDRPDRTRSMVPTLIGVALVIAVLVVIFFLFF
ncbi:MAG: hypothetical protein HC893_01005 [Chloroflexaceae bacterium]|nr:hypothetical protein [Chloroflexaceae bacterium]NJL32680.1 hypothetical protein [Chloroflexaceae bacterium]NJO05129.1 hypothetical protein [Chloroflexaceae bacterium]